MLGVGVEDDSGHGLSRHVILYHIHMPWTSLVREGRNGGGVGGCRWDRMICSITVVCSLDLRSDELKRHINMCDLFWSFLCLTGARPDGQSLIPCGVW